jgi:hypothetical protein
LTTTTVVCVRTYCYEVKILEGCQGSLGKLDLLDDLYNVFVTESVVSTNFLWLVPHRAAPHPRILELCNKLLVKTVAKVLNRRAGVM